MTDFRQFEVFPDHAECLLSAKAGIQEAAQMITGAIIHAREQQQRNLLLDITGLCGFEPPGMGQRFFFFEEWARASRAQVRVAFVARPEMIDARKFGITVAANNNFTADAFTSREEALGWLRALSEKR